MKLFEVESFADLVPFKKTLEDSLKKLENLDLDDSEKTNDVLTQISIDVEYANKKLRELLSENFGTQILNGKIED